MTLQWIATRLRMGNKSHVSHLLYWQRRAEQQQIPVDEAKRAAGVLSRKSRKIKASSNLPAPAADANTAVEKPRNRKRRALPGESPPSGIKEKNQAIPLTDPYAFDPASD